MKKQPATITEGLGFLAKLIARKHLGRTTEDGTSAYTGSIGPAESHVAAAKDLQTTPSAMEISRA